MQSAARPRGVTTLRGGAGPAAVGAHMVGSILYTGDSDDSPLPLPVVGAKLRKGQDLVSRLDSRLYIVFADLTSNESVPARTW